MKQSNHNPDYEPRKRLDQYVLSQFPQLSRSYAVRLISEEKVRVNNQMEKPGYKLRTGDTVTIDFDASELDKIPDIDLPVVYEDDSVLVINKPAGVISHSRGRYWDEPSVASYMRQHTGQPGERSGIVHRLDRPTSGIMICAKNQLAMAFLQKQFADRTVIKTYKAIVSGHMSPQQAIIDMPIERNPKIPASFRVGSNGKTAQTKYKVIVSNNDYDQVELEPATGRTHQLRVHLAHQGHPIVGDTLYGGEEAERLYLHAFSLQINIPGATNKVFTAPLPNEFEILISPKNE
jgi:23S rRNA pseudouridine1911/1915/1917 synthase